MFVESIDQILALWAGNPPYDLAGKFWTISTAQTMIPEAGQGVVQAFRRDQSAYETAVFPLKGLESNARYRVTDLDVPEAAREWTGAELMTGGLRVTARERPQAVVVSYRRL